MESIANIIPNAIPTPTESRQLTSTPTDGNHLPGCPDCGGLGFLRADVAPGEKGFGKPIPCPNRVHQGERLERMAKVSNMLPAELDRSLADIKPLDGNRAMLAAARKMVSDPFGWLYIWGGPGNAKSEVLIAIIAQLNREGKGPAVYTKFATLIEYMRDAYSERKKKDNDPDTDLGYIARFEKLKAVKVLAIDEMDKARETPFMQDFRFDFLDERYRQALAGETITLFASNENPATLPEAVWDRVRDGRFKVVENTAPSARPKMRR
jgi:DNA replication protein DnaC